MPADYTRIHRLLRILTLVQGAKGWSAKRLAGECGTSERNIYRDLKMLEGAGIPFSFDKQTRGYEVRRDFFMPAVSLTLDESLALIALGENVGKKEQIPFTAPAGRAIEKVRCSLPSTVQQELSRLDDRFSIQLAAAAPPDGTGDVYDTIRSAMAQQRALSCEYESLASANGNGAAETFIFEPYALFFGQRAWYAVGLHRGHGEVRTLKLSRFTRCIIADASYTIPGDFTMAAHLGNAWRMIRGGRTYAVELKFDKEFADTIAETHWHSTQQITWRADGSILFRCRVDGLDEIVWWILSMGPHCIVRKPRELAERVRTLASQTAKLYSSRAI